MDLVQLISLLIGSPLFGILIDISYAQLKNKTPYIKRIYAWITNKKYKVQLRGIKKYSIESIDINSIKELLFKEFGQIKIISQKTNSLVVLIENMQAPYEILIINDEGEYDVGSVLKTENIVDIALMGSIEFRYRESDDNDYYFNTLNKLFDIIEHTINEKPNYSFFTLQADLENNFEKIPFITEHDKDECEDTKIDIDKSAKFIKINSKTKDNLYKCLKKNIYKILWGKYGI